MRLIVLLVLALCAACVLTPQDERDAAMAQCTTGDERGWTAVEPPANADVYRALARTDPLHGYQTPRGHRQEFWFRADGERTRLCVTDPRPDHGLCDEALSGMSYGFWSFVETKDGPSRDAPNRYSYCYER